MEILPTAMTRIILDFVAWILLVLLLSGLVFYPARHPGADFIAANNFILWPIWCGVITILCSFLVQRFAISYWSWIIDLEAMTLFAVLITAIFDVFLKRYEDPLTVAYVSVLFYLIPALLVNVALYSLVYYLRYVLKWKS
jgi:hypothetical protein